MVNKKNILVSAILILSTFIPSYASSLVQMDIKKTSESAVDVTFFTTEIENRPLVTRKSNNKYVILMPSVAGDKTSAPDLSAVKDIITNVDIKNVDDGISGYTKVTFITTKPVNIKTYTQKIAPLTSEEKEAKALIAKVKADSQQSVVSSESKKENTSAKTPTTGKILSAENKKQNGITHSKKSVQPVKAAILPEKISEPISSEPAETISKNMPLIPDKVESLTPKDIDKFDIKEIEKVEKIAYSDNSKKPYNAGWTVVILPLLALYMMLKMIKSSVHRSKVLRASFAENLSRKPYVKKNYDNIINDSELNWQERYQKFVQESNGQIKNRRYNFIKTNDTVNKIDEKRIELENTLSKTPEIYKPHEIEIPEEPKPEVQSEDNAIQKDLNEIKLKAFAKPLSLHTSNRNRVKKALPKMPRMKEGKFVKLETNPLNATSRRFRDANLKVSDLIKTGSQYIPNDTQGVKLSEKEQNYIMSSVEEYFALLDKEQARKITRQDNDLSKKVAASLAQVKPSMKMKNTNTKLVSNPIENKDDNYLDGLVVKSGYNIDENRGFYLVSLDGITALVGRVKEEIFVLKKFDENVNKLQVRLDEGNVYMVKAGDFKSLVDVDENKMGVLIEL